MNVMTRITTGSIEPVFADQQKTAQKLRTSTAEARIAKLKKLEAAILNARPAIYAALLADLHKPEAEADLGEVMHVVGEIRYACRQLRQWMRTQSVSPTLTMLGTQGRIRCEPKGVVLIISPWNYPLGLTLGPLTSALAAGNTAIVKPSEFAPHTAAVMANILASVFPTDEVALFEGDASVSTELLSLPFDHIFFTGSPAIGKIVMGAAAKHLSSVTLELGGKSPVVIDASADLEKSAASLMWGKFLNAGQTCIAPDYIYVHESVMPGFINAAQAALAKMYGADIKKTPDYCRIISDKHMSRLQALLDDAKAQGATLLTTTPPDASERFMAPTIVTHVPGSAKLMSEEIFGPILPLIPYTDLGQVISEINAAPKPLALYIYSKDQAMIDRVIGETSSGAVGINIAVLHFTHHNLPFGGVNNSGLGSSHGVFGFRAFSHQRAILRDRMSVTPMLYPPYTPRVRALIKATMKYFT